MSNPDLTAKYEEERLRAHEQSQMVYLQSQIDELRRQLRDQTNKYNWAMEQVRKTEASVAQVQGLVERHSNEVAQTLEISRRDIVGLRKEIAAALIKIDEGIKPMRDMQAQIHQVAEARKQDRDQFYSLFGRIDDAEQKLEEYQSQIKAADERHRQLVGQLDRLREADTAIAQESRKVAEDLQIEKQSLRRQIVEAQQYAVDFRSYIEDHEARIERLDEIKTRIELFAEQLPGEIEAVAEKLPDMVADTKRVERISTERFLMNQERLEELRHQADERISVLQEVDERHLRQLTSWLERIDGWVRELEQRIARSTARVEVAHQENSARIVELERRELTTIFGLADAFRVQSEAVRNAQIQQRGDDHEA